MTPEELLEAVRLLLGDAVLPLPQTQAAATVGLRPDGLPDALQLLRDDRIVRLNFLMDLSAIDFPEREPRFELVYLLSSIDEEPRGTEPSRLLHRLCVKVRLPEETEVDSVAHIYPSANWLEREVWDLYGIPFRGHPQLERILLDPGFTGHPLRRDFPRRGQARSSSA